MQQMVEATNYKVLTKQTYVCSLQRSYSGPLLYFFQVSPLRPFLIDRKFKFCLNIYYRQQKNAFQYIQKYAQDIQCPPAIFAGAI